MPTRDRLGAFRIFPLGPDGDAGNPTATLSRVRYEIGDGPYNTEQGLFSSVSL